MWLPEGGGKEERDIVQPVRNMCSWRMEGKA